jgi:hypothetical protein
MNDNEIRDVVREEVREGRPAGEGGARRLLRPGAYGLLRTPLGLRPSGDPITSNLYADHEKELLPTTAVQASLGCGNPTALAKLEEGQVVLDLGSGGGIDVLLRRRGSGRPARPTAST